MASADLLKMFLSGVKAVHPYQLVANNISFDKPSNVLSIVDRKYNLTGKKLFVVGAGKAVYHMAEGLNDIVGFKIDAGILSVPKGSIIDRFRSDKIKIIEGATNNLPDGDALNAAREIKDLVASLDSASLLIVLISGGGSALLPYPILPITLDEKLKVIKDLVRCGASINDLNIIRKKLSGLKGGKLANLAKESQIVTLILSDIIGDPIDLIASGPTVADTDNMKAATDVIEKFSMKDKLPKAVYNILYNTTNINNVVLNEERVINYVIGNNSIALEAARNTALENRYDALILSDSVQGNVKDIAETYVNIIREWDHISIQAIEGLLKDLSSKDGYVSAAKAYIKAGKVSEKPICLIAGGEPTVTITGTGKGGRNQELALRISTLLPSHSTPFGVNVLCAGTDGIDGPTDAAGSFGYTALVEDASQQRLYPMEYIKNNDSYNFYQNFRNGRCLIKIGHTNTNVMDIHIITLHRVK